MHQAFVGVGAGEGRLMRSLSTFGELRPIMYLLTALAVAALPLACTSTPPPQVENRFVGNWATAEDASITIRPDTIIQHQPNGESTTLDASTCRGVFGLVYATKGRDALIGLISRQPELRRRLSTLLPEQSYQVVEVDCDRGDQTYVLLNDRELLAIYRDREVGAIERLARR